MNHFTKIFLKKNREKSVLRLHPWIFSGAIEKICGNIQEGDIVEVLDFQQHFLCLGHFQIGSIAVRIFSFEKIDIDKNFWKNKFLNALKLREKSGILNHPNLNTFRLIHGEGDFLPSLIIDIYDKTAVLQFHSIGMLRQKEMFAEILREILPQKISSIFNKSENTLPHKADISHKNEYLFGEKIPNLVNEYGNKFFVDIEEGQKTGFFIDQRENRKLLESFCENKKVLNLFCYTGGFSVSALKGGATFVKSIDSSQKAIDLTLRNIELNFENQNFHSAECADVMRMLENIDNFYDVIIVDPPAFAKHLDAVKKALRGYINLNKKVFEKIKSSGIVFTFSCSQVISKEMFREAIFTAALESRRNVQILYFLGQPSDHPVSFFHPEGEYLKGLVLFVE